MRDPGNLPDKVITSEVNELERSGFLQNDGISKYFLPHQEVNWKPLASKVISKKLFFRRAQHC